jgi:hypothetical protein
MKRLRNTRNAIALLVGGATATSSPAAFTGWNAHIRREGSYWVVDIFAGYSTPPGSGQSPIQEVRYCEGYVAGGVIANLPAHPGHSGWAPPPGLSTSGASMYSLLRSTCDWTNGPVSCSAPANFVTLGGFRDLGYGCWHTFGPSTVGRPGYPGELPTYWRAPAGSQSAYENMLSSDDPRWSEGAGQMQGAPAESYFWVAHFNIPVATASQNCRVYFTAEAVPANGSVSSSSSMFRVTPPLCAADFDGDGSVGSVDLAQLLANFGEPSTFVCDWTDINQDGITNGMDLSILLSTWGQCAP